MLLRLCVRAWREVADGIPANSAKFAQQWRRGEDCALARRLRISERALQRWGEVEWLAARRVLTWMRLVRAGAVHRERERCAAGLSSVERRGRVQFMSLRCAVLLRIDPGDFVVPKARDGAAAGGPPKMVDFGLRIG